MGGCRRCEFELLHCHGTLVRHEDGAWECEADGCTGRPDEHDLVLTCADLGVPCCAVRLAG